MAELKMEKLIREATENIMNEVRNDTGKSLKECFDMQIPKKMMYSNNSEWCPVCTSKLLSYDGLKVCYCKFCGQKIIR